MGTMNTQRRHLAATSAPLTLLAMLALSGLLVAGGCAGDATMSSPAAPGTPAFSAEPVSTERVNCSCGSWAGTKGLPTECKKTQQAQARAAAAAREAAKPPQ